MSIDARTIIGHAAATVNAAHAANATSQSGNTIVPIIFEGLEGRQMMSAVSFSAGTLSIQGSKRSDDVRVSLSEDGRTLSASLNGSKAQSWAAAGVYAININAGDGNNRVSLDPRVTATTTVVTGIGRDTINTGAGNDGVRSGYGKDVINTGSGNDMVDAGASNDRISLGSGNDLVVAGSGNDFINGGSGWDKLYGRRGNDTIQGKPGDVIDAGAGRDSVVRSFDQITPATVKPQVTRLSLVNADTGAVVSGYESLWSGMTFDLAKLPSNLTVVAQISGKVESARFKLSDNSIDRVDDSSAYSLGGGWRTNASKNVALSVTPYTADGAKGTAGDTITMWFTLKSATPQPNPQPTPTPTPQPVQPGSPTVRINAMQTTVIAGQAFHAEATRTVVPGHQVEDAMFAWDFGDPYGRFNAMPGFNAAHVYETPGTYTAKLTVTAPGGQKTTERVTVNVIAANYRSIFVAADGSDSNDGSSQNQAVRTLPRAIALAGDNTSIFLKRGDTFTVTGQQVIDNDNVVITSYGSGTNPTVLYTGGRSGFAAMLSVTPEAQNVTIRGLTFNSIYAGDTEQSGMPHAIVNGGRAVTIRDNTFLNVGYAINNNQLPKGLLVMDNKAPLDTGIRGYFVWAQGNDLVIIGNTVANSTREHIVRVGGADRIVLAYNKFTNLDRTARGDSRDNVKSAINSQKGSYSYIAYNQLRTGSLSVGPLGGADGLSHRSDRFTHSAVEGNVMFDSTMYIHHGAENVTVRGNMIYKDNGTAITINGYNTQYGRGVVDLVLDHNLGVNNAALGSFAVLEGKADGVTLTHNVYVAPYLRPGGFGVAALYVNDSDLSSFRRIDANAWPSTSRGNAYSRNGIIFLGKSFVPENYVTAPEWNAFWQVGNDTFQDVQLDDAESIMRIGTQSGLRLAA